MRKLAPTEVELEIEVSQAELDKARERAFRKLSNRVRVPGFRPGHVPRRIFEQHVGVEQIEHEALDDLVPEVYADALREHNLDPVDRPKLDFEHPKPGEPLRVKATVAVRPEIALGAYAEIKVAVPPIVVTDEEVEHSLQALRRRAAILEPVADRGVQMGDVVTLDYEGSIGGIPFEGGSAKNHSVEVTESKFIPGFAEQILGAKPEDRRDVHVTFPESYHDKTLAGKAAAFAVAIHEIKQPVLPDLDAAFAKLVSDSDSIEALRKDVHDRLELAARRRARDAMEAELVSALVASHDFPLPEVLVEREVERMMADARSSVRAAGRSWEAYVREDQIDEAQLGADMRKRAEERVKSALLLEEIAKAEKVETTASDIEREITQMARATSQTPDRVLQVLREGGGLSRLANAIRREKTVGVLLDRIEAGQRSGTAQEPAPA